MREPILKAVAMPPRLFMAPFVLAMANFVVQVAWMFLLLAIFDANPIISLGSVVFVHVLLIMAGTKEPHLSHMLQAWGTSGPATTHNIYRSRGVKLAP